MEQYLLDYVPVTDPMMRAMLRFERVWLYRWPGICCVMVRPAKDEFRMSPRLALLYFEERDGLLLEPCEATTAPEVIEDE